jgi:putative transposase
LLARGMKEATSHTSSPGTVTFTRRLFSGRSHGMSEVAHSLYRGHRFPAELISQAVWLYFRFPRSLRMVEDLLVARGFVVSHETVRRWAQKFGRDFANTVRRRAPQFGNKWHHDEVVVTINGKRLWLWRAVDQDGFVLDALVQGRRDRRAAERLLRKLIRKQDRTPRVLVTDKLRSYGAARADMSLRFEHRQHKGLNNRAENSPQPTRRRERIMKRFKSARHLQRFVSIHDPIANLFHFPRHSLSATQYRTLRTEAMIAWSELAGTCTPA